MGLPINRYMAAPLILFSGLLPVGALCHSLRCLARQQVSQSAVTQHLLDLLKVWRLALLQETGTGSCNAQCGQMEAYKAVTADVQRHIAELWVMARPRSSAQASPTPCLQPSAIPIPTFMTQ